MLKNNYTFSVAPMMGVTTPSARFMYRLISKKAVLFTEMIASQAIYRGDYNKFLKSDLYTTFHDIHFSDMSI